MIGPLFLGILLLAALIFFAQWFGRAEPARAARALKWTLGAAAVGVAIVLAATGRLAGAAAAVAALAPLLLRGRSLWWRMKAASGPTMASTLSRSISSCALVLVPAGLPPVSAEMNSTLRPAKV